jgi:membrane associated rhomboid family serine protease
VLDLNHLLLFLAIASPLAVLGSTWSTGASPSWRIVAGIVLFTTAFAWIFFRRYAGYVGGGAWLVLLFLPAIGLRRMAELSSLHQYKAGRKLAGALQVLHPSRELRQQVDLLRDLESRQVAGLIPGPVQGSGFWATRRQRLSNAPVVIALIVLNAAVFLLEVRQGYRTRPEVLLQLGALDPIRVIVNHEYWRLFTALFLHYGAIHLFFNVFALYVLGPPLERAIGASRFLACYLISGIGSSAGVVVLTLLRIIHPAELVGASGCVMGIVGAWAGFLLRHRHVSNARRRLNNIFLIIIVQFAFDISTPQVSTSAHLCGLVTGLLVGLLLARGKAGVWQPALAPADRGE